MVEPARFYGGACPADLNGGACPPEFMAGHSEPARILAGEESLLISNEGTTHLAPHSSRPASCSSGPATPSVADLRLPSPQASQNRSGRKHHESAKGLTLIAKGEALPLNASGLFRG